MPDKRLSSRTGSPKPKRRGRLRSTRAFLEQLAETVRTTRVQAGLTQEELAGLSNTGARFIIDLEHAKPTLELGKVIDVLQTLGLEIQLDTIRAFRPAPTASGE